MTLAPTAPPAPEIFLLDSTLRAEKDYWCERLAAVPGPAALPADVGGGPGRGAETVEAEGRGDGARPPYARRRHPLPPALARRLGELTGGSPLPLFAALVAGLVAALARRGGGRSPALLGSPALPAAPGRGPNAVPLVVELAPEAPFRRQLLAARDALREAYARQSYPWARLAREAAGPRAGALRFGVVASLAGFHGPLPEDLDCDLVLAFALAGGRLEVEAEDRGGRYRPTTLRRFLDGWAAGLAAALADLDRPPAWLGWLSAAERHQLCCEWAEGPAAPAADRCLHQLVAARAAAAPEEVAVTDPSGRLTFGELARRAGGLRRRLGARGVGPEARVGVLLERSGELVAALLAVLEAGAAYLPLDPALPAERRRFLLADSGAALLVTRSRPPGDGALPETPPALLLDRPEAAPPALPPDGPPGEAPAPVVSPDQLAYLVYTSGSTGRPKGVMVPHRALVSYLLWAAEAYRVAAGDGAPVATSVGFDLTVTCLFTPLVAGRAVHLLPGDSPAPALAAARQADRALSLAKVTPAHLELLAATLPDPALAAAARAWVIGGDALHGEQLAPLRAAAPGTRWINEYGPTETTVGCCVHEVGAGDPAHGPVPIGRPIAGARLRLLGPDLDEVPAGRRGELYIGGAGVARGYHGRPALTAERFVPDPRAGEPGGRLYRTGDLAVHRPDGALVYLGRCDRQVKIRGHRVEPGEIEAVLLRHPGVRAAAVVAREDHPGAPRLVAYVAGGEEAAGRDELRTWLADRLPAYMVPGALVTLPALPLTANGKVDREALPAPPSAGSLGRAPGTPVAEIVAGLWQELLGAPEVGAESDFFSLGGHSLLATRLSSRLRRALDVEVPPSLLFEAPTLADFAHRLEAALLDGGPAGEPLRRSDGPRRLSPGQESLWFVDQLGNRSAVFNIPAALRIGGRLEPAALAAAAAEVARRHEVLRSTFPTVDGLPAWEVAAPGPVPLPRVDLARLPPEAAGELGGRLARGAVQCPLDLARGPLWQALLLGLGPEEHLLVLVVHHIVADGWSMAVLVDELTTAYRAAVEGRMPSRPEPAVRFADVARWQRRRLEGGDLDGDLAHWRTALAGAPALSTFPPDRPRGGGAGASGALLEVALPAVCRAAVEALGRHQSATPFMVLMAAFASLLHHATGQDDLVVGTDFANRSRLETEALIGYFVQQLPLRLDLSGDPSFGELVARVRRATLEVYRRQALPLGRLLDALGIERSLKVPPLFQVKFLFQSFPRGDIDLPGLTVNPVSLDTGTTQFDLVLALQQQGEGLGGWINYDTALFLPATVEGIWERFRLVVETAAGQPDLRLSAIEGMLARKNKEKGKSMTGLSPFKKVQPKAVQLAPAREMVELGSLAPGQPLPLVVTPKAGDVEPVEWAASARSFLEEKLRQYGAILFRGFGVDDTARFEHFAANLADRLFNENGEHPRESVTGNVYTPVFYPPEQKLLWHNENSFNLGWPRKILFACARPADRGGETPIVDSRRVLERLSPQLRQRFLRSGVMYVRNYGGGLGLDWQTVFQTDSRAEVEEICRRGRFEWTWRDGDRLRTRAVRPAAVRHPASGEMTWFNQAQHWHVACLDPETRRSIESMLPEEDYPRHCYFGDGSPIPDADMEEILAVYRKLEVAFPWQRGDVMLLDNVLTAHARNPFSGERRLLVAMGEMTSYDDLEPSA